MNYKLIWKIALIIIIVVSAIMVAPSLFRMHEFSDSMIRILGIADIIALFVLVFSFVKSYKNIELQISVLRNTEYTKERCM